ncbi:hypothetical protein [Streptomyces sp. PVA_94-07]|uniref:hypothetical protein n=1 Tax=Streptomyces sp. PVA_94-07 TaxID=1225337 RepID=UPI0020D04D76|nr:hypothetical protein [Streptomyces sp. PVA_94-07]
MTPSSSTDSPHPTPSTPSARIPQDPVRRRRAPGRRPIPSVTAGRCLGTGAGVGVVEWAQVTTVTGQFRLECRDGRTAYGQAGSWTVDGAGVPDCQEPLTDATPTARDAALLARGGDDPANTGAKPKAPEGAKKTS